MRARSALFTLFGDVILPAGGDAWLRDITAAMGTVGVNPTAVRTALHRMAAEGWVEPSRSGRFASYCLTDRGVGRLNEAANRIYRLRSQRWDGRWRLVASEALATRPQFVAELEWIGFGRLQPGLWISPHDHSVEVRGLLADLDAPLVMFDQASSGDDEAIVERAWDLDALRGHHRQFLARWGPRGEARDDEDAFRQRLELVHEWRKFLFDDPGLPDEVLPASWEGHRAAAVFKATYERLLGPSWRWWASLSESEDRQPMALTGTNPFAKGLAALGTSGGGQVAG